MAEKKDRCGIAGVSRGVRHRLLLVGLPAALLLLGASACMIWSRTSAINTDNAAKIEDGMTLAEVEDLLGGPARNESDLPDNFIRDAFDNSARPSKDKRWASPGLIVFVDVDDDGRVVRHSTYSFSVGRSPLDKLRRWLHL
jgi:hypothetical protein